MISKIKVDDFFNLLDTNLFRDETVVQFPLEYFQGTNIIYLYKTFMNKTYSTVVLISDSEVFIRGESQTSNQFIQNLKNQYKGIEIAEPLDYNDMIIKHTHDMHTHLGNSDIVL
jgi:hypothetical protein